MATLDQNGQPIIGYTPPVPTVAIPPAPTAQAVYSAPNITQAITAPVAKPNLADPYGLLHQFMSTPEILAAQNAVAQGQAQINTVNQGLRTTTRALENQNQNAMGGTGASINLIGRQVGRARQLTADELTALGETQQANLANLATLKETGTQLYQIAQQEREQLKELIRATGGKAGISFADSYETALKKASKWESKQKKDQDGKELRNTAISLGISLRTSKGGTKSSKQLQEDIASFYKEKNKPKSTGGSGGSNSTLKTVADVWKASGGNWTAAASVLADKGIDVSAGSAADNEMRRRAGLAPIKSGGTGASSEAQKLMDELGVSESVAEAMIKKELGS